jgi:drug/metabolite transporter (DMT)-like permease
VSTVSGGGALDALGDRVLSNVRVTSANASAWLAVLGLPLWLVAALRRPHRLRPSLDPDPRWRDAVIVLAIAGIAGYLLNDTYGLAGSAFAFVSAAMLYPTLASASRPGAPPGPAGLEPPTDGSHDPRRRGG